MRTITSRSCQPAGLRFSRGESERKKGLNSRRDSARRPWPALRRWACRRRDRHWCRGKTTVTGQTHGSDRHTSTPPIVCEHKRQSWTAAHFPTMPPILNTRPAGIACPSSSASRTPRPQQRRGRPALGGDAFLFTPDHATVLASIRAHLDADLALARRQH
jgi:hypothetical protein